MAVRYDARLARSVLPPIAKGLVKNLSVDIAAKFSHRTYPGVADTRRSIPSTRGNYPMEMLIDWVRVF